MRHILHTFLLLSLSVMTAFSSFASSSSTLLSACDGCPKPNQIKVDMVSDTAGMVSWEESDSATSANVRIIQVSNPSSFIEYINVESPWQLRPLKKCELYTVEVLVMCGDSSSGYSAPIEFMTDGCCRVPTAFAASSVSDDFANFSWDDVSQADSFLVRYKLTTENSEDDWKEIVATETNVTLDSLKICAAYDVQIKSMCHNESSEFSESYFLQTVGCGVCTSLPYCSTGGIDATNGWIDSIAFANIFMKTGFNDGYFAYTTEQTALERGRMYDFFVAPGFSGDTCSNFIRVWLDLDQDGSFNDSTELLLDTVDLTGRGVGSSFMLADTLLRDITRLRISMKPMTDTDTVPQTSCGLFNFGEVEDYCIRVDEPCPPPENVDTLEIGTKSATITWDRDSTAFGYIYSYNVLGENDGEEMITGDTIVKLDGLKECTEYVFKIISVCEQDTDSTILQFKTKCETAVEDLAPLVSDMKIYPNPFSSQFHLEFEAVESLQGYIQLSSITGQIMHSEKFDVFAGERIVRDFDVLTQAAPGIYILVIQTDNRLLARKLIKSDN